MPLNNMMVMCGDAIPVVIYICDCTDHMSDSGEKDVTYIAEMFQEKGNEFGSDGRKTYFFFFESASNVQKTGQILCQTFPRAYCFHGREPLFYSDISKLSQSR